MTRPQIAGARALEPRGRITAQRAAILDVLARSTRFRTAQDTHADLRARGASVGLTTVYRHLQQLADEGTVHSLQLPDRQTAYRLCSANHHHHLVCTRCGAGVEIPGNELEDWVESEAAERGYSDVTHSVEIFGTCPKCSDRSRQRSNDTGATHASAAHSEGRGVQG